VPPVPPADSAATPENRRLAAADDSRSGASLPQTTQAQAPPPSMQDVAALNADSDFKPFIARTVAPEVRNAAMKKLFSDPHFNLMDGLDIYIDDYSIPDPLPASMLRKMASAQFMNLFDEEQPQAASAPAAAAIAGGSAEPAPSVPDAALTGTSGQTALAPDPVGGDTPASTSTDTDKTDPPV